MIQENKKWTWKKTESRWNRIILRNHYEWCKANGRDTKWYKKDMSQVQKTGNNSR